MGIIILTLIVAGLAFMLMQGGEHKHVIYFFVFLGLCILAYIGIEATTELYKTQGAFEYVMDVYYDYNRCIAQSDSAKDIVDCYERYIRLMN